MKLIIAEKPSVAAEIAKVIGASKREDGYLSGNDYLVSWCVGHLIELAYPEAYNPEFKNWNLDTLPIIPDEFKTDISPSTAAQFKVLKDLMSRNDVTELVEATDAGREGELIFRLVYEKAGCRKPFKRLWISSMEEKSIKEGLANMKDGRDYDHLYESALCRQRADWLVGINLTRLYSKMYNKSLKTGRVQTPTLNLIVKRQREITNFNPQTYFTLIANLEGNIKAYKRVEDNDNAMRIVKQCTRKTAYTEMVEQQEKQERPDALYDLTTLQRDANRLLGYSAQQTLTYMQTLYDSRLATYPRTDSRYLTSDMEGSTRNLIDTLIEAGIYDTTTTSSYNKERIVIKQVINDKKVTDHHGIIPTSGVSKAKIERLPEGERNILLLVSYRLLSAVYAAHKFTSTKAIFKIEGEEFSTTGKVITELGFKQVEAQMKIALKAKEESEDHQERNDVAVLPPLTEGDTYMTQNVTSELKKTLPAKSYTEDTLLAAMETAGKNLEDQALKEIMKNSGLGTSATRASTIESIIATGYVQRSGRKLLPTDMAYTYMDLVPDTIKEPQMTAEWEQQLAAIQNGEIDYHIFMNEIIDFLRTFVAEAKETYNPEENKSLFKRPSLGNCPKCGKNVVEYGKSYSCETGKDGCGFVIWKMMAGKEITSTQAVKLLTKGKTDIIKGFTGSKGKFDAYVVFKEDKSTGFAFPASKKQKVFRK